MENKKFYSKYLNYLSKQSFVKNKTFLTLFSVGIILNIILLLVIILSVKADENLIQIKFDSFYGVTKTGRWYDVYFYYLTGLIILVVDSFLAFYTLEKEKLISFFIMAFGVFSQIIIILEVLNLIKFINH